MSIKASLLFPHATFDGKEVVRSLSGKTILITGATFGIGEALVRCLWNYDVQLILVARTTEKLLALKHDSLGYAAHVTIFTCDFNNEESVNGLCSELQRIQIHYFVSNAGKSLQRSLKASMDRFHDYKRTISVNYLAPVQLILALIGSFKKEKTHIVNISTYSVLMKTPPEWSAYISSKKAMHSWFESIKPELALMDITVSTIYLPLVEGRMKDANQHYKNATAMSMKTAVAIIIKGLLKRNYDFRPWWHVPLQAGLVLINPFWIAIWKRQLDQEK